MGHFLGEALDGNGVVTNKLVTETESTYAYLLKVGDLYVEKLEKDSVKLTKHIERALKLNWNIESQVDVSTFCRYIVERASVLSLNYTIVEHVIETRVYETPVEIKTRDDGHMQLVSTEELRRQKVREEQEEMEREMEREQDKEAESTAPLKVVDETMHGTAHGTTYRITDDIRERTNKDSWAIGGEGSKAEPRILINTEPPELDDWSKY